MKTYSFEELDNLLVKTLKEKDIKLSTVYLDELKNGEFSVSIDDGEIKAFEKLEEAETYFNSL